MGAGQSSGFFGTQQGFIDESTKASEIPKKILTLMFKHADFTDLLTLSNIEACPQYVFTSAQSLGNLFERIQIRPERGPAGEYIFAPIRRLAPELLKNSGATQPSVEDRLARDSMCVDVAYYHVRIFQIYAAIALTVLNTNPLRGSTTGYATASATAAPTTYALNTRALKPAALSGMRSVGGRRTRRKQVGGRLTSAIGTALLRQITESPFYPFLQYFFSTSKRNSGGRRDSILTLKMDGREGEGDFIIEWVPGSTQLDEMTLDSYYVLHRERYNSSSGAEPPEIKILTKMRRSGTRGTDEEYHLIIGRNKIAKFTSSRAGDFLYYIEDDPQRLGYPVNKPEMLIRRIHEHFGHDLETSGYNRQSYATGSREYSSSGARISRPMGKSSFDGFDILYKMYGSLFKGEVAAPKAYMIARAMTLMMPIMEFEQASPNEQVFSSVCKSSRLQFETSAEYLMPRPGTNPRANIYLRSFVSLFYDTYHVQREKNKKGVVLEKSQPGASELARASRLMAKLYNIPDRQEEFLESNVNFKGFESICGPARSREITLYYTDPELKEMMRAHIRKMLEFQNAHNERANRLLMRMFVLDLNTREGEKLVLSRELEERGLNSVNDFCKEARELLLDYYLKSEAFYISGIIILENNKERLSSDALATRPPSERGYDPAYERQPY